MRKRIVEEVDKVITVKGTNRAIISKFENGIQALVAEAYEEAQSGLEPSNDNSVSCRLEWAECEKEEKSPLKRQKNVLG